MVAAARYLPNTTPVSYTHLDVYKRQAAADAAAIPVVAPATPAVVVQLTVAGAADAAEIPALEAGFGF